MVSSFWHGLASIVFVLETIPEAAIGMTTKASTGPFMWESHRPSAEKVSIAHAVAERFYLESSNA